MTTPPFITPFAILSVVVLIGTSNLVVNHVTHTHEGVPARPTRVVNDPNRNRRPSTLQNSLKSKSRSKVIKKPKGSVNSTPRDDRSTVNSSKSKLSPRTNSDNKISRNNVRKNVQPSSGDNRQGSNSLQNRNRNN